MEDAIEMLKEQHRDVDDLFEEIGEAAEASEKREIFDEIADQLTVHANLEERHFYPAIRSKPTDPEVLDAIQQHLFIKRLLVELMDLDPDDPSFDGKLTTLKAHVQHHFGEEEKELFPRLRKLFDDDALAALAAEMAATQDSLIEEGEPRRRIKQEIGLTSADPG